MSSSPNHRPAARSAVTLVVGMLALGHAHPTRAMQAVESGLDPIDAVRPGNQGADPVAPGIIQLEFGYAFERDSDQGNSVSVQSIPDLLLVLGVSERFDLRVWATGLVRQRATRDATGHGSINGIRDVTIGSLIHLADQTGGLPAIGIQPSITVPVGTGELSGGGIQPEMLLAASWAVVGRFGITWNGVWRSNIPTSADAKRNDEFKTIVDLGVGLTERLGLWVEHSTGYSTGQPGLGQEAAIGLSFRLADHLNVDGSGVFGLSGSTSDFTGTVGMSIRWPLSR